ncbi:MAG: 30S ribosomal protein S9 [Phycisphaeraceae bacterium]|nr:30S ribosomal protein S9 [Phycisphaeraceae bacterium]
MIDTSEIETSDSNPVPSPESLVRPVRAPETPDIAGFVWGTGRRKSSTARVRVRPAKDGKGSFLINGREVDDFFRQVQDREAVRSPLKATGTLDSVEVRCSVIGGGFTGQAGAVLLGLARALRGMDPALEPVLREHHMLTRDPREVERKKYGQPGARRRFQFSKR